MLLTILIVLAVYLLSCYAYGAYLLLRTSLGRRDAALGRDDLRGVASHRYPTPAR